MDSFIGEIRMFGGNFAPQGWAFCDGSIQSISQNDALFNLIGTTYGGDGQTTFALPDFRGRFPIHQGNGFVMAQMGGTENETLVTAQLPVHTHIANSNNAGGSDTPVNNFWGASTTGKPYVAPAGGVQVALNAGTIQPSGGNGAHDNMHPFLVVNYIISLNGIYPSQN